MIPYNDIGRVLALLGGRGDPFKTVQKLIEEALPARESWEITLIPESDVEALIKDLDTPNAAYSGSKDKEARYHAARLLQVMLDQARRPKADPLVIPKCTFVCPADWDLEQDRGVDFCSRVEWRPRGWYVTQRFDDIRLTNEPVPSWIQWHRDLDPDPCIFPTEEAALEAAKRTVHSIRVNQRGWNMP